MPHSVGKVIKDLRRRRGLTQEELAEKIGVTAQAVSKWENGSGMPSLFQIVPLAHTFGVSTDVLLGMGDTSPEEDIRDILSNAQKKIKFPLTIECLYDKYNVLLRGIEKYPNNYRLLMECMETEISLAYPSNPIYDKENGRKLYESCERHAASLIGYDHDVNRILRARMIMVLLHSAYGNFTEARNQAEKFPSRVDFNIHNMYASLAHFKKDYKSEAVSLQFEILNLLWTLVSASAKLGESYALMGDGENAAETYKRILGILDEVFSGEIKMPFHHAEKGDIYILLAQEHMKSEDKEGALSCLEKAIEYDLVDKKKLIENGFEVKTPLLSFVGGRLGDRFQNIDEILSRNCFAPLREEKRFKALLEMVKLHKTKTE